MIGFTPAAKIPVYHIVNRRRAAEAICKHGVVALSSTPPKNYNPCPTCFGRVKA